MTAQRGPYACTWRHKIAKLKAHTHHRSYRVWSYSDHQEALLLRLTSARCVPWSAQTEEFVLKNLRGIIVIFAVLSCSLPARAQIQSQYQVTPYLWASSIDGTVGARGRTLEIDESFSDIWSDLTFAAMGTFQGRWDRWVLLTDGLFINLSTERTREGSVLFSSAKAKVKTLILDPEFGYQVLRKDGVELNVLGGGRFWSLRNELQFSGTLIGPLDVAHRRTWIDPVVGAQFRADLPHNLYVTAKGDIGGFKVAADIDWQAFGGVGIRFNDRVSGIVGYRHLGIDYSNSQGFVFDTAMKGLVLAIGIRF